MLIPLAQRISRAVEKYPEKTDRQIASSIRGATVASVRAVKLGLPLIEPTKTVVVVSPAPAPGVVTIDQVRKRYDIVSAIKAEVAALAPGTFVHERELVLAVAGKDVSRFRRAVDNAEELKAMRIRMKLEKDQPEGCWYWGRPEDVLEARRLRDE